MRMDTLFKPQNKLHNFQDLFKDLSEKKILFGHLTITSNLETMLYYWVKHISKHKDPP